MLVRGGAAIAIGLFDALFRPSRFVQVQTSTYARSRLAVVRQVIQLVTVWGVNLLLYAVPLTLSGVGFTSTSAAPGAFALVVAPFVQSPDSAWQFLEGFVQNSAFLTVATALAFAAFHGSVIAAKRSRGIIQSLHTVVYTTSAYLAGMFSVVMYLSTASQLEQARQVVLNMQARFIYWIFDLMGVNFTIGVQPGPIVFDGLSQTGATMLAALALLTLYFIYSMYLGARLNHQMSRIDGSIVVVGVLASPAAYIAGSVVVSLFIGSYGVQV